MPAPLNFTGALEALTRHRADFILVGGVAAVLWGAPITTFDLDILYKLEAGNLDRLLAALREIESIYRDPAGRRIEPDVEKLKRGGHHLLSTRFGPLDVLGTIGAALTFEDLLPRTREMEIAGLPVRTLEIAAIIETKEHANRDKDRAVLPVLRETERLRRETDRD